MFIVDKLVRPIDCWEQNRRGFAPSRSHGVLRLDYKHRAPSGAPVLRNYEGASNRKASDEVWVAGGLLARRFRHLPR